MTTPLSDERIAKIRERATNEYQLYEGQAWDPEHAAILFLGCAALELLGEVERLRGIVQWREALADCADDLRAELGENHKALKNCDAEVSRLRARVACLEGVLRSVEWGADIMIGDGDYDNGCLVCLRLQREGHAPDCELDAALRDAHD